jgi:uncharacterized protein (TIGR02118 family)
MISVHILYPRNDNGSKFDMVYYTATHMPMLAEALGDACQGWGATEVAEGPWQAIGWATVDSQDAFNAAMAEHGARIMADVANYTNVQPQLVLGQIKA